ncbi:MAG: CDP-alcohol phosphatidyltransferase family protein [Bacilli bacterium]|nr:CDP-alcohol phosphatidyltransferase family protein [Bacilli bacterium]
MKYSYKQIKDSLTKKKNSRSSLWVRAWVRRVSFPITYLFINAGWSANMVSILSWVLIFCASALLCVNNFWFMLSGVVLTNFWLVLDCVDGNIARVKKKKNYMGDFFDAVAGYGPFTFTTIGLGVAAYNTSSLLPNDYRWMFVLIAGSAALANCYMRLIHQKYLNCFFVAKNELGQNEEISLKDTDDRKSFAYIREQIDKNLGVSGLFMPLLFVALFTNTFDIMVLAYSAYYILSFIAIAFLYCKKASLFDQGLHNENKRDNEKL